MSVLRELPRGVGERGSSRGGAQCADPELARQQVSTEERQRVREEEEGVVADDRRMRTGLREDPDGRVPDERVREGERVVVRPERVRLPQVERRVHERVTDPGDLPRLQQRIAEVLPDVAAQVQNERPRHDDRQHDASAGGGERLTPGELSCQR